MAEQSWNSWFDAQLDLVANGLPFELPSPKQANGAAATTLVADLQMAARLANLDLSVESKTQANLRTRLAWMAMAQVPLSKNQVRSGRLMPRANPLRASWFAGLATVWLAVCLVIFNQPVLAMVQHLLGYGYMPEVGFFSLSNTYLLKGPVELRQNERQVLIRQGISLQRDPDGSGVTWLWIEGNLQPPGLGEIWLNVPQHQPMPVQAINPDGSNRVRLAFEPLPTGTNRVVLHLSEGWQIPLEWIRAADAGLVPTQVSVPTSTQASTGMAPVTPCLNVRDQLKICAQAAYIDEQKTHLLLELQPLQKDIVVIWNEEMANQVELLDGNRKIYPIEASFTGNADVTGALTLQFAALPNGVSEVTLHLPGIHIRKDGKEEWIAGPFDLPLRLPARGARISPTPTVIQISERRPVPTPVPNQP